MTIVKTGWCRQEGKLHPWPVFAGKNPAINVVVRVCLRQRSGKVAHCLHRWIANNKTKAEARHRLLLFTPGSVFSSTAAS